MASGAVEDRRWWMHCQPYVRALRASLESSTADKDVEAPLQKCVSLYMAKIQHHSLLDDKEVLITVGGVDVTAMEASFMWLGGWRPTAALLLVYSLMGMQLEDEILNFKTGVTSLERKSPVLSEKQLTNLTNVQKHTRQTERKISKKFATLQMLASDQDVIAAIMIESSTSSPKPDLKTALKPRISRLKKLLIQADQLRLHTLHQLFLVLTPVQVPRCAIAGFELAFTMRALGSSFQHRKQADPSTSSAKPLFPDRSMLQPDGVGSSVTPMHAGSASCSSSQDNSSEGE